MVRGILETAIVFVDSDFSTVFRSALAPSVSRGLRQESSLQGSLEYPCVRVRDHARLDGFVRHFAIFPVGGLSAFAVPFFRRSVLAESLSDFVLRAHFCLACRRLGFFSDCTSPT